MTAITTTDLNNAKLDVNHIADIATSTANNATDRLGHTKLTMQGASNIMAGQAALVTAAATAGITSVNSTVNSAVTTMSSTVSTGTININNAVYTATTINNRGSWTASTAYAVKDIVIVSGTWYVTIIAHTSSSAFSTDSATKWRVYQGVTTGDLSATSGAAIVGSILDSATGAVPTTVKGKLQKYVDVYDFGVVGDGSVDDTIAFQKALDFGASANLVVRCFNSVIRITGPVFSSGPGIVWDRVGYSQGISVTGSGYTALTVTGRVSHFDVTVYGTGNTANGILFDNITISNVGTVRVVGLNGFGVKASKVWDSTFVHISVELCGNASEYAFSVVDGSDTSNMSHFMRIQVEQSNQKAMYISPLTLGCVFDNIHSERATPVAGVNTWTLGGNGCLYNQVRLDASGGVSADATVLFSGANCQFNTPRVEGNIDTSLEGFTGNPMTFINPDFRGITHVKVNQLGIVTLEGGVIANLVSGTQSLRCYGVKIGVCTIGFTPGGSPYFALFDGCEITTLGSGSTTSAAIFDNCNILGGGMLQGKTILSNCQVNLGASYTIGGTAVIMNNTIVTCSALTVNSSLLDLRNGSYVVGSLTSTGNKNSFCDDSSYVTGTVTGWTAPIFATFLPGGVFSQAMRSKNLSPAVGSPKAWTYAGSAWVSEGNL